MKLIAILICILGLTGGYASVYSQQAKLNLKVQNMTVKDVLKKIEDQSEYSFMYNASKVNVYREIDLDVENSSIEDILKKIFTDENVSYRIMDRHIIISTGDESFGQQKTNISGKVTDSTGQPLPGVSVVVKGTTTGTITDFDGKYTLSNVPAEATLVFSFVGMKSQEFSVVGKTTIDVKMEEETIGLDEVIAIGYGTQKKESLTGAVDQVKMDDVLRNRPVSNLATALQGAISSVQITTRSGFPGQPSAINIRGTMSINGGSPLILVDNVPIADLESINPSDIESVSVLKDASSSSIYGGRAAFGVLLITTKKGVKNQPVKFNYTCNLSTTTATDLPVKATAIEQNNALLACGNIYYRSGQDLATWNNLLAEYQADPAKYPNGDAYVNNVLHQLAETDMYKKNFTNSFEQMHNFSFSGGTEKSDYRVSFGYADEDGILIFDRDTYRKFNINASLNNDLTKKLSSSLNIIYKNDKRLTPASLSRVLYDIATMERATNTGVHYFDDGSSLRTYTPNNVLKYEVPNSNFGDELRIFEKLEYKIMSNFKLTGEYTFIKSNKNNIQIATDNKYWDVNSFFVDKINKTSSYYRSNNFTDHHALNLYASYDKTYRGHELSLLVGTNQEVEKSSGFWAQKLDLLAVSLPSLATATGTMTNSESFGEYSISGYFSRLKYAFKDKYLLEANIRYDGSSRFPKGSRYGLFPSLSGGWIMSEESFMKPVENIINFMKIRGSWGEVGNQVIVDSNGNQIYYPYIPSMGTFDSTWINESTNTKFLSIYSPALVSSSLTWETVRTKNIGIDMSFLDRRLYASFDYFHRLTLNMLGPGEELPKIIGASAPQKNVADLVSKGWELSLDWKVSKPDFGYSLGLRLWDNRAFITKYANEGGILSQYYKDYEFGQIWGYETYGYYTTDDFVEGSLNASLMNGTLKDGIPAYYTTAKPNPGDIRYVDFDGDGKIDPGSSTLSDPGDRKIIGNSTRRYQFGITANCNYKNFDLSFLIQGIGKRDVWISGQNFWPYISIYDAFNKYELDFWTPENANAYYPRMYPTAGGNTANSRLVQTKYLLNGAYLSLKNVELGYTFPKQITRKLSIDFLRVFVSGENLLKLDHLPQGIDTELADLGNGVSYPLIKKISFGVNLTF